MREKREMKKMMKQMIKYVRALLWGLPFLCLSCAETDLVDGIGTAGNGRGEVTIDVSAPALKSNSLTRAISEENESSLNGDFAVFAFDSDDVLIWVLKTGDTNTETNLKGEDSYDDNTSSTSLTWHQGDEEGTGRLYIEGPEYIGTVKLLVLANVDLEKVDELEQGLTAEESKKDDVVKALSALDFYYSPSENDLDYIPMSGETVVNGIMLGTTGTIQLRRSLAKFTINFEWTSDYYDEEDLEGDTTAITSGKYKCFMPTGIIVERANTYATVYSADPTHPNISTNENQALEDFYIDIDKSNLDFSSGKISTKVEFYVVETKNSKNASIAYGDKADEGRFCIVIQGTYYEQVASERAIDDDGNPYVKYVQNEDDVNDVLKGCSYRFDMIPEEDAELGQESADELDSILRNNNYIFTLRNVGKRGSSSERYALGLTYPDNYRAADGTEGAVLVIEDDDLVSVTADYYNVIIKEGNDEVATEYEYYYVAVSSIWNEIPRTQDAVTSVKVETNAADSYQQEYGWRIDNTYLPYEGIPPNETDAFSFVYDDNSSTLWIWLDHPEYVEVGATYYYYIVAGNIRKKMRLTITEGDYVDDDGTGTDDGT